MKTMENGGQAAAISEAHPSANLVQIVYVSSAVEAWSHTELLAALEKFRANNVRRGVTGMLLHCDGNFMQAIEGPADQIEALEAKIGADPRHFGFIILLKRTLAAREFRDWSMGFRNLNGEDLSAHPGWSDFLGPRRRPLDPAETPGRALRLLHSFRDSLRR